MVMIPRQWVDYDEIPYQQRRFVTLTNGSVIDRECFITPRERAVTEVGKKRGWKK